MKSVLSADGPRLQPHLGEGGIGRKGIETHVHGSRLTHVVVVVADVNPILAVVFLRSLPAEYRRRLLLRGRLFAERVDVCWCSDVNYTLDDCRGRKDRFLQIVPSQHIEGVGAEMMFDAFYVVLLCFRIQAEQ